MVGRLAGFGFLLQFGESQWMRKALGVIIIATVIYSVFADKLKANANKAVSIQDWVAALLLGIVGGFISGAFAAGGPFYVMYMLLRYKDKNKYYAQLQATLCVTNLFSVLLQAHQHWDRFAIYYLAVGILAIWIGQSLGLKLFHRLPKARLTQFTYLQVCIVGIRSLF